jgi:pyrroline-5-carboxylate reductase
MEFWTQIPSRIFSRPKWICSDGQSVLPSRIPPDIRQIAPKNAALRGNYFLYFGFMFSTPLLGSIRLGILGCGRLGLTLAKRFSSLGVPSSQLKVSYGGDAATLREIQLAGLDGSIVSNSELCQQTDFQIIAIPPRKIQDLEKVPFRAEAQVVSAMAAISTAQLRAATGMPICRMMPSGPDTILGARAIAAIFPETCWLEAILLAAGFRVYILPNEEMMHFFTVGVCLPAAFVFASRHQLSTQDGVDQLNLEYGYFAEISEWAKSVIPVFRTTQDERLYIGEMATAGGITEAILTSMDQGNSFLISLQAGLQRSKLMGQVPKTV